PWMWAGFAIAFGLFLLNGLHQSYPALPELPVEVDLRQMMRDRPWSDISMTTVYVSPGAVGFFYLLPADLLLSFWFFFLFGRVQEVAASSAGMEMISAQHAAARHFVGLQTIGSFIVLAGYLFYIARGQWRRVLRAATRRGKVDDAGEMIPYRWAFWGLIASIV